MNTRFPVYIISLGRWKTPYTANALETMNVDFNIVVEPKEYHKYASVIDFRKIIVCPENFSERKQGSIPVRNFVWHHSLAAGHTRHWILDDNIRNFQRVNRNKKHRVYSPATFKAIEDFTERYKNIGLSGMNYEFFVPKRDKLPPFYLNTRIYSCILINNYLPFRWRGKYNEDTDLSLRVLKAGFCTVLFNAFVCKKIESMLIKGGNTDTIYNTGDDRLEFAESLQKQHPDLVKVTRKYGRFHHSVNYRPFSINKLIRKKSVTVKPGVNNYGMVLKNVEQKGGQFHEKEVSC